MYEVLKYIHENIKVKLVLTEVAKKFGYSEWHFARSFHNYTGKTFTKYIRYYRIRLAALDILSGEKATNVALDYGYESLGGFNKAFLGEFGCLPQEYKKRAGEAQLYAERKKITMYKLTDRCEILRKRAVEGNDFEDYYCMQYAVYFSLGAREAARSNGNTTDITAGGIVNTLKKFSPVIMPGELIVGFNFPDSKYNEYFTPENTEEHRRLAELNGISREDIDEYFNGADVNFPKWVNRL